MRERGDAALREWSLRLDGVEPARASRATGLPSESLLALADSVRRWHELQRPADVRLEIAPGVELERRWVPLRSVGIYVPRALVSTLVMCAVPAQVAGVERIVVMTPPDGSGLVAAAAELIGIDEVWAVGGPQAIAALAYGTETIARVDKIVGPGNAYVNEAKLLVVARRRDRPSRRPVRGVVVLGSGGDRQSPSWSSPRRRSTAPTRSAGSSTASDLERALAEVERSRRSISSCSATPRRSPAGFATQARSSSAPSSAVAGGDYATGGNHVLPTGGWARAVGGLGLETFMKPVTVQRLTRCGPRAACDPSSRRWPRSRECRRTRRRCAMRPLPASFRAVRVGAVDRGARAPGRPRPGRHRALRRQRSAVAAAVLSSRRDRGRLAAVNEYAHGGYPALLARSPTTQASSPRTSCSAPARDDLILLCARAFAGPGDRSRSPRSPRTRSSASRPGSRRRGRRRRSRS